jgi:hypothetical protein
MRWSRDVTPELLAHIQHRYEETDEPVASIAADCEVRERRIYEWIVQHGWRKRRDRPPSDLPPELRLSLDLDRALEEAEVGAGLQPDPAADEASATPSDSLSVAQRLERQLEQNLTRVERMREMQWPQGPADAERTTRVLERLTQALLKVRQLRNPDTNKADVAAGTDDFDIPGDIDEFRRALARRIEAFVRSRTGASVPGPGESRGAG